MRLPKVLRRGQESINKLYPELVEMGASSGWPWGVSRLIDGIELVADQLPIDDRFGYSFVGGHGHCALPAVQRPEVEASVDKFLLGKDADTSVRIHAFQNINAERWFAWWGSGQPEFPDSTVDKANVESVFLEVECGARGDDWRVVRDAAASNGAYATIRAGANSTNAAPTGPGTTLTIPFNVRRGGQYYLFGRVNAPSAEDDSIYLKFDDGEYAVANGLGTVGWQWVPVTNMTLAPGEHTVTITYREDGALLDKLDVTTFSYGPDELGGEQVAAACAVEP